MLITPMRDATVAGPMLRKAHRRARWYLANEFLTNVVGFEKFLIPHVQGHNVGGYRLLHESQTLIAALMQGGKPMAFGVNDAFPRAMFFHADHNEDITSELLKDRRSINSGGFSDKQWRINPAICRTHPQPPCYYSYCDSGRCCSVTICLQPQSHPYVCP